MQTSQYTFGRSRVIVLYKITINTRGIEPVTLIEGFKEETTLVFEHLWFDNQDVWDVGFGLCSS